jgi:hypothetical protein
MEINLPIESSEAGMATLGFRPDDEEVESTQPVGLPESLWAELSQIAKFESAIRASQKVKPYSRARLLKHVLADFAVNYWGSVGGKPETEKEMFEMAEREGLRRRKEFEDAATDIPEKKPKAKK